MSSLPWRLLVGLGVPFVGVVVCLPLVDKVPRYFFGMPAVLDWMFLWFGLTSACLAACWFLHDRTAPDEND
ncbi:DUF3311 domain-containing protein [Ameyamaea chiangmaiensis]|uniref:DUF3311 domain-containing protein n=2 Tax=Ameyamaea chiangmaiensis TaxID=442969 RepID=A0A850P9F1_9PROT|nr:DUF3311 domain-containing protein [Ameyamaea chiangmaiensis]